MWLSTIVMMTAGAQDRNDDAAYEDAVDALIGVGESIAPVLPVGFATAVLADGTNLADTVQLIVTILKTDDDGPSKVSVKLDRDYDHDGDVDGRDFLLWQRGGSPSPLSAGDLAMWQSNYGTSYARIDAETWLAAALPDVDDEALLKPPADVELLGFEVVQDGKVRGGVLLEVRVTAAGLTEVVTHLWATAALEPVSEVGNTFTITFGGQLASIPEFYEEVVLALDSDPIETYEQTTEIVLKSIDPK